MRINFNRIFALYAVMVTFVFAVVAPIFALAADAFPIPEADISAVLLNLATNYKTLGTIGILAVVTLLSVQAIKAFVPENWKYKRLTTLGVAIVYSVLSGVIIPGSNVVSVIVTVFFTSGGAMALYEALKGAGIIKTGVAAKPAV